KAAGRKNSMQLIIGLVCINLLLILAVVIVVMIRNRDNLDSLNDNSNVKPPAQSAPAGESGFAPASTGGRKNIPA
ncbi:MAG: hypothetical protein R3236_09590, partial [Phycisphaeraceae bacterium]|nr:hypothetical protein [Phycisphaeraceae bacterium]